LLRARKLIIKSAQEGTLLKSPGGVNAGGGGHEAGSARHGWAPRLAFRVVRPAWLGLTNDFPCVRRALLIMRSIPCIAS